MSGNIPRISGIDPKVAKLLQAIKNEVESLQAGDDRVIRISDLGAGFQVNPDGSVDFSPVVVPSVTPEITQRIEALEAVQTDVSTLADEILGDARFGTLIGAVASDVKSLKVDVNGHIAGLGVASYGGSEGPVTSDLVIQADRFSIVVPSPEWRPSFAYTLGQYVSPTREHGATGFIYRVTTAGTTGTVEPTWPTTPGNTVASGTAVFTTVTIDERVPFIVGLINGVQGVGISGDLVVDGTIHATSIAASAITADKIAAGAITADKIAANLVLSQAIEIASSGYIRSGQTAYDTGTGWWLGNVSGTPKFSIGDSAGNKVTWNGTTLTVVGNVSGSLDANSLTGTIPPSNFDISTLGWTITSTFSATDGDTVAWTSGTLYTAAGDSFSIASGNTGNMGARTYIFFDINVSTTVLQTTTTAADAVGPGRILIAVAEADSPDAFFQVFGGSGSFGVSSPEIPSYGPLANGDFETNSATGWVTDASWSVESATLITGSYAARVSTSTTGLRSDIFPCVAGDRFLITCNVQRDAGSLPDTDVELAVRWYSSPDGSPNFSSSVTGSHSSSAVQMLRLLVTVPSSSPAKIGAQVAIRKPGGASGRWYVDNVFVTPVLENGDVDLGSAAGTIDLATQISGILTTAFAAAGLINSNVTINADGTLSGAGGGQASLNSLPGTVDLTTKVSGTLSTSFAAAGLINANVTVNADGTLSGAGSGQVSLNSLPGAISAGQINANAVTTAKLAAGAVTAAKIDAGTITANEIAAGTITGNRLAANTVTAANIAALTITAAEIAASTITGSKIASQTIVAGNIAANTITAGEVALNTLTAANIAASSITGSRIAAATIIGTNIAAGTITASNLAAGTITSNEIAANAITANTIATGAVTAGKLAATLIYGGEIVVDVNGMIRSGQTAFNTGIGWFLGNSGGTPRFSIGNSAGNRLTWDGVSLAIVGNLSFTNAVQQFAPTWGNFVTPPPGNMFYLDFGAYVIIWFAPNGSAGQGSGTAATFTITNLPPAIWPASSSVNAGVVGSFSTKTTALVAVTSGGVAVFSPTDSTPWPTGIRGIFPGSMWLYPKL